MISELPNQILVENVFFHDGKYTYPTSGYDEVRFFRMCKINSHAQDHHVWIEFQKQHTIGEINCKIKSNNYYQESDDSYFKMNKIITLDFFSWCNDIGDSWGKKMTIHENAVYVEEDSIKHHNIYVTYSNGERKKVICRNNRDGIIHIKKGNPIIKVEIFDKPSLKKELVKTEHTLDLFPGDNCTYLEKFKALYEFSGKNWSVEEGVAREFLKKTKMDISNIEGVISLEGRRFHHSTDDWLDIKNKNIIEFQGSQLKRCGPDAYGLRAYLGEDLEDSILTWAFTHADKRFNRSPKHRFSIGDKKFRAKSKFSRTSCTGYSFFDDVTGEEIPHKEVLDMLKRVNGKITIEYHQN